MSVDETKATFGERLYSLRKQQELNQEHLAEKVGISRHTIQRWESGETQPIADDLSKLANIFNVSVDYLIGRSDKKQTPKHKSVVVGKDRDIVNEEITTNYNRYNIIFGNR